MNKTANMPSLAGLLDVIESWAPGHELKFVDVTGIDRTGMDATVSSSVGVADRRVCSPTMVCPMGGACVADPIDQAMVDQCPEC